MLLPHAYHLHVALIRNVKSSMEVRYAHVYQILSVLRLRVVQNVSSAQNARVNWPALISIVAILAPDRAVLMLTATF